MASSLALSSSSHRVINLIIKLRLPLEPTPPLFYAAIIALNNLSSCNGPLAGSTPTFSGSIVVLKIV